MSDLTPDLRRRTAHQSVYDTLRRAILRGSLRAGTRLVQADIAAQLQVSTTPVREALRDLATEGLIQLDAHRGAIVKGLDVDQVREVYELRLLLEPLSIRKAVERITDEELARAEALQARMDGEQDVGRWVELNRDFHAVFAGAAHSPYLARILKSLRDSAAAYVAMSIELRPTQLRTGNDEHHRIIDACRRRDADAAVELEVRHLHSTMEAIELGLEQAG